MSAGPQYTLPLSGLHAGTRLDRFLAAALPAHSRSYLQRLIKRGLVKYDGAVCLVPKTKLPAHGVVTVQIAEEVEDRLNPEKMDLPVLYEDEFLLVINKPAGLVVHPAAGHAAGTLVNALLGRDAKFAARLAGDDEAARRRPGIVHRLDKDSSGCLVVAKSAAVRFKLAQMFASRKISKIYAALVVGAPGRGEGEIVTQLGRHPVNRKKMAVVEQKGRQAVTRYEVLARGRIGGTPVALLKVRILTGRTHQIRVHLAYRHLPVLGDRLYGGHQPDLAARQMLHAWQLGFPHPATGQKMTFSAPFPDDFQELLALAGLPMPLLFYTDLY